jgi:ubiquinone/menaquinone biosynthesis C-methylase UbiE
MSKYVCPSWLSFSLENGLRKKVHKPELLLKEFVKPGSVAVDIGCGPGYFSIPMAKLVGKDGKVISVDLQRRMLDKMNYSAKKHNVEDIIQTINCTAGDICVSEKADFVLTFWMVHEVEDVTALMKQIQKIMKPGSLYLLSEPFLHVSGKRYAEILTLAESAGLKKHKELKIWGSRSMIFTI